MFKDQCNVRFSFGFLSHDFDPALTSVLEKPFFTAGSLLDDVESFFVGDIFQSLDFVDDFGLELFWEVLEDF